MLRVRGPGRAPCSRACGLSGAGVMIVELTTTRLFAPWFGASIYSWTNVIAVVLLALACGYALGGKARGQESGAATFSADHAPRGRAPARTGPATRSRSSRRARAEARARRPRSGAPGIVARELRRHDAPLRSPAPDSRRRHSVRDAAPDRLRVAQRQGRRQGARDARRSAASCGTYLPALVLLEHVGSRGTIFIAAGVLVVAGLLLIGVPHGDRPSAAAVVAMVPIGGAGRARRRQPLVPASHGETSSPRRRARYQYIRVARWPGTGREPAAINLSIDEGILEFHSRKREATRSRASTTTPSRCFPDWVAKAPLRRRSTS